MIITNLKQLQSLTIVIYSIRMEEDLRKLIKENRTLLLENREILENTQTRVNKIQRHLRRSMVGKTIYWIIVITITAGAVYFSKPYIDGAIETYQDTRDRINQTSEMMNDPARYFKDVDIAERINNLFKGE